MKRFLYSYVNCQNRRQFDNAIDWWKVHVFFREMRKTSSFYYLSLGVLIFGLNFY